MKKLDDSGIFPFAILIYLVGGIIGFVFFVFFIKQIIYFIVVIAIVLIIYSFTKGYLKTQSKHTPLVIIFIIIVLVILALGSGLMFWTTPIKIDTKTHSFCESESNCYAQASGTTGLPSDIPFKGSDYLKTVPQLIGGSYFKIKDDATENVNKLMSGEIFNKEAYAVAWKVGIMSEDISMQGIVMNFCVKGVPSGYSMFTSVVKNIRYDLYWYVNAYAWELIQSYKVSDEINPVTGEGEIHPLTKFEYNFVGKKENGAIRVVIRADVYGGWLKDIARKDVILAADQAYIYSGVGDIEILNENKIVAVGEDLQVQVKKLGYSAGRGWTLELFSYPQNRVIDEWTEYLDDGQVGVYSYTVTSADWIGWIDCDDPQSSTPNRLEARLYNNLWEQDEADADTIDIRANAPPQPTVTLDKDWYNVNDTITITIQGERNENTELPFCYFLIDIYYQPGLIQLTDDEKVIAIEDSASYESDPLPQSGTVRVEVTGYDAGGHPSEHTIVQKTVKPYGQGCNPLIEDCGGGGGLDWNLILLIIIIVAVVLVGYYFFKKIGGKRK